MIATLCPLLPAISDRLIEQYFPELVQSVELIDGNFAAVWISAPTIATLLLVLAILDYRKNRKLTGFPIVFIGYALSEGLPWLIYGFQWWQSFVHLYMSMPLS